MGGLTRRFAALLASLLLVFTVAASVSALPVTSLAEEPSTNIEDKVIATQEDATISPTEMLVVFQEGTSEQAIAEVIQTTETADPAGEMVDGESGEPDSSYVLDTPMDEVVVSVVINEDTAFEDAAADTSQPPTTWSSCSPTTSTPCS